MLGSAPIIRLLGMPDPWASFSAVFSGVLFYYFTGIAMKQWMLWMAASLGVVRTANSAVSRYGKMADIINSKDSEDVVLVVQAGEHKRGVPVHVFEE